MLARVGRGMLWGAVGYVAGAVVTYALTMMLSSNVHDRQLEAAMTAAFAGGPLLALVGFIYGVTRRGRLQRE